MGISKDWGIETAEQHFQKSSYPLQSGIVWGWANDSKLKMYYHNIGEVGLKKDGSFTGYKHLFQLDLSNLLNS